MRFKIHLKLVIFSIVTVGCFIILVAGSLSISNREFEEYIYLGEIERAGYLSDTLSAFYGENGGWAPLIDNYELWMTLLKKGWSVENLGETDRPEEENYGVDEKDVPPKPDDDPPIITVMYQRTPNPSWDPLDLSRRISLYDLDRNYIAGVSNIPAEECTLLPIHHGETVVAWLGLKRSYKVYQPLSQALMHSRSMPIIMIICVFVLILAIIAVLFSKHMLTPIARLAEATKKLGQRDFNVRIPVSNSDEIGDLANHFNNMAQKLENYERNQQQWLADISHELRTPLSALICDIDALMDGVRTPDRKSLVSISQEARHLKNLVNDIHDISLIESGAFSVEKKLLKPIPILCQKLDFFQNVLEDNNISLTVRIDPSSADLRIKGDEHRLMQLFSNIIDNTIRHTTKPANLTVSQQHDDERLTLIFEDSGPGVPEETLPKLFHRLYRADASRNRATGGSGLGLSICKSIVEMHDGTITLKNGTGGGLRVEVDLPLAEDENMVLSTKEEGTRYE